jgi:hypothetical protein
MNHPEIVARVREYRSLTASDARAEAQRLGLGEEERTYFLSNADSNAIWDAQEGRAYRKPVYTPRQPPVTVPLYDELGFLTDEEYKRIMGKERKK